MHEMLVNTAEETYGKNGTVNRSRYQESVLYLPPLILVCWGVCHRAGNTGSVTTLPI